MKTGQLVLILLAVAGLALVGWWMLRPGDLPTPIFASQPMWEVAASAPLVVGTLDDPFAYAGGDGVLSRTGQGTLRLLEPDGSGFLQLTVTLDGSESVLSENVNTAGVVELRASIPPLDEEFLDVDFHGSTGRGDGRLPKTHAMVSGIAYFSLRIDGESRGAPLEGLWSVAHALRREDGSVRNQGLAFSPLLRDDTVFADPDRLELTLLLYGRGSQQTDSVVLHLVYRDVEVLASPDEATSPATSREG